VISAKDGITKYFLRVYAAELRRSESRQAWGAFGEAVFQTVFFVFMPMVGVCETVLYLLLESSEANSHLLMEYRLQVIACIATVPLLLSFVLVKALVWSYKGSRENVWGYDTNRDRVMSHLQFWTALVVSLALPWIAAACVHLAR
jgi:hypothetical protein